MEFKPAIVEQGATLMLQGLGLDLRSEGLKDTPHRMVKAYRQLCRGLYEPEPEVRFFHEEYDELVITRNVEFHSICEHHLLPFFGHVDVGYLPAGKVAGLSKIPRYVDWLASRPTIQERFTQQLVHKLEEVLQPEWLMVRVRARHLCVMLRGAEKWDAQFTTQAMGKNKSSEKREEFLKAVANG